MSLCQKLCYSCYIVFALFSNFILPLCWRKPFLEQHLLFNTYRLITQDMSVISITIGLICKLLTFCGQSLYISVLGKSNLQILPIVISPVFRWEIGLMTIVITPVFRRETGVMTIVITPSLAKRLGDDYSHHPSLLARDRADDYSHLPCLSLRDWVDDYSHHPCISLRNWGDDYSHHPCLTFCLYSSLLYVLCICAYVCIC